jgi:hypothetical protein
MKTGFMFCGFQSARERRSESEKSAEHGVFQPFAASAPHGARGRREEMIVLGMTCAGVAWVAVTSGGSQCLYGRAGSYRPFSFAEGKRPGDDAAISRLGVDGLYTDNPRALVEFEIENQKLELHAIP